MAALTPTPVSRTLAQWAAKQPYIVQEHANGQRWIPDANTLVDWATAWKLTDYRVMSVSGGTIWFSKR